MKRRRQWRFIGTQVHCPQEQKFFGSFFKKERPQRTTVVGIFYTWI
jgi:hypothetical protein